PIVRFPPATGQLPDRDARGEAKVRPPPEMGSDALHERRRSIPHLEAFARRCPSVLFLARLTHSPAKLSQRRVRRRFYGEDSCKRHTRHLPSRSKHSHARRALEASSANWWQRCLSSSWFAP